METDEATGCAGLSNEVLATHLDYIAEHARINASRRAVLREAAFRLRSGLVEEHEPGVVDVEGYEVAGELA